MKTISILVDVLGPIMRGPSSSHTAGAYHIARLARSLLGGEPAEAEVSFDPGGSYGKVYREQGSDLAFAAGLLGWSMTDERFPRALESARDSKLALRFAVEPIPGADHPNAVAVRLEAHGGSRLSIVARSIGGGAIEIVRLEGWPVRLDGGAYEVVAETDRAAARSAADRLQADGQGLGEPAVVEKGDLALVTSRRRKPFASAESLRRSPGVRRAWLGEPLSFVREGEPPFRSAAEMAAFARAERLDAGRAALAYERQVLGLPEGRVLAETERRLDVMLASVREGLRSDAPPMQLLRPTAGKVYAAVEAGRVAAGGLHARAAARALAALHVSCAMGVVCAAPTAGSAGVIPATMATLIEDLGVPREKALFSLLASGAIGAIVAERATFAAEVAGCQVEIGAAGAMAAAAVVDAAGGSAAEAADAAAIAFQNAMGSVCDLVQGVVEIPCHTRNAAAASSAFVCADLVLGGYENPVPLDETIDAVYAVGKALPPELRCTALGGIAVAPSALRIPRRSIRFQPRA